VTAKTRAMGLASAYHRRLSGLSVDTAAACAHMQPEELAAIEAGTVAPSSDVLSALAEVYRTSVTELLARSGWIADRSRPTPWRG